MDLNAELTLTLFTNVIAGYIILISIRENRI